MISSDMKNTNPWNGLRTYTEGEVIYGRSEEIQVLSLLILQSHQTVVYGRSGIGKSSILNAGIFPIVRKRGVFPVYVRFEHNVGLSYLVQIKDAIKREIDKAAGKIRISKLVDKTGEETLWEFFHRIEYTDEDGTLLKPLIVFDQFEEIFTLETNKDKVNHFFRQLADLINNVMPERLADSIGSGGDLDTQSSSDDGILDLGLDLFSDAKYSYKTDSDYHLVFTLREDFLSYLERNTTDIPALKNNRYCLQPIDDEQAAEIIMQPRPGLVDKDVAKLIIEKVTGERDFEIDGVPEIQVDSAILSLYLSRIYDKMVYEGADKITAQLVEAHSDNIIGDFYMDAISGLPAAAVQWLEDTLINEDGRRDNRDRSTVIRESGLSESQLDRLVNEVKLLRQFSYGGDLRIEFIHDVLCPVIEERRRKRKEDIRIKEIEDKARIERRKARSRIFSIVLVFAVLAIIIGLWLYRDYYLNEKPYEKYYSEFTLVDGWPVGVGEELSAECRKSAPIYYRLGKKGHKTGHFTYAEAMSSYGSLPSSPKFEMFGLGEKSYTDKMAAAFYDDLSRVSRLEFIEGSDGQIDRVVAKADNDSTVFLYTYFHLQPKPNAVAWLSFLTPDGRAKALDNNGIDRIMIALDSLGRIDSYMYYDQQRIRTPHGDVFGKKFAYNSENSVSEFLLDNFATPLARDNWNSLLTAVSGDSVVYEYRLYSNNFNDYRAGKGRNGAWKIVETPSRRSYHYSPERPGEATVVSVDRDGFGRTVKEEVVSNDSPLLPHLVRTVYDKISNNVIEISKYEKDGKSLWRSPFDSISRRSLTYVDGVLTGEEVYSGDTRIYLSKRNQSEGVVTYESENKLLSEPYLKCVDSISGPVTVRCYFGADDKPVNVDVKFHQFSDPQKAHRIVTEYLDDGVLTTYFEIDGKDLVPTSYKSSGVNTPLAVSSKKEAFDEMGNLVKLVIYDENGNIRKSMRYDYENGVMRSRSAMGIDGNPVRSQDWEIESYGYYKLLTVLNENKDLISVRPVNEFDQSSVFFDPYSSTPYVEWSFNKYMLENEFAHDGKMVKRAFIQPDYYFAFRPDNGLSSIKVAYVHVLDTKSPFYGAGGLKDGDRIVAIDDWIYSKDLSGLDQAWKYLKNRTIPHSINVLRPIDGGFSKVTVNLSKGFDGDLYAKYYVFNLSAAEAALFESALKNE